MKAGPGHRTVRLARGLGVAYTAIVDSDSAATDVSTVRCTLLRGCLARIASFDPIETVEVAVLEDALDTFTRTNCVNCKCDLVSGPASRELPELCQNAYRADASTH